MRARSRVSSRISVNKALHFPFAQVAKAPNRQLAQLNVAYPDPFKVHHWMAGRFGDHAYLSFATLDQNEAQPCGSSLDQDRLDGFWPGRFALDRGAGAKPLQFSLADNPSDLDPILFVDTVAGMHDLFGPVAVVGKEEQAGAVFVQSADGKEPFGGLNEVEDGSFTVRGGRRGDHAGRFVEREIPQLLTPDRLTVDRDGGRFGIGGVPNGGKVAVDSDASGANQLLGVPSRGDSGLGQNLLDSL